MVPVAVPWRRGAGAAAVRVRVLPQPPQERHGRAATQGQVRLETPARGRGENYLFKRFLGDEESLNGSSHPE